MDWFTYFKMNVGDRFRINMLKLNLRILETLLQKSLSRQINLKRVQKRRNTSHAAAIATCAVQAIGTAIETCS